MHVVALLALSLLLFTGAGRGGLKIIFCFLATVVVMSLLPTTHHDRVTIPAVSYQAPAGGHPTVVMPMIGPGREVVVVPRH